MSVLFKIENTSIESLFVVERLPCGDQRGYFERLFCASDLEPIVSQRKITQINHSYTAIKGNVRGMHFQYPPDAEVKLVTCLRGTVLDVAVDIRNNSRTFLKWHAEILSQDNHRTLIIPEGFAHGFQTLSDDCEMLYFHTASYTPNSEGGLSPTDPLLDISWPLPISGLSKRDSSFPLIDKNFEGVLL